MSDAWIERGQLRIFAIVETRKSDGKCGIVMTGYSRHLLKIAMGKMILKRKQARTDLSVVEFSETLLDAPKLHWSAIEPEGGNG